MCQFYTVYLIGLFWGVKTTFQLFNYSVFNYYQQLLGNKKRTLRIECIGLYSEGLGLKIKVRNILGIFKIFYGVYSICSSPLI